MRVETYKDGKLIKVEEKEVPEEAVLQPGKKTLEERIAELEAEIARLKNVSK